MSRISVYRYPIQVDKNDYLEAYSFFFWKPGDRVQRFHNTEGNYFINEGGLRSTVLNGHLTLLLSIFMIHPHPDKIDSFLRWLCQNNQMYHRIIEANLLDSNSIKENKDEIATVFDYARRLNLTTGKSKTVAATKTLHFLFPDLFVILDNAHTVPNFFRFPKSRTNIGEYPLRNARKTKWENDLRTEDYVGLLTYLSGEIIQTFDTVGDYMFFPCEAMLWPEGHRLPYARITDFVYW